MKYFSEKLGCAFVTTWRLTVFWFVLSGVCMAWASFAGTAWAIEGQSAEEANPALTVTSSKEPIKVGYTKDYGVVSTSSLGQLSGYGYEYLQRIAHETGWTYQFIQCSWGDCLDKLKKGELDILGPMQYSTSRAELFDFPYIPLGYEHGALYVDSQNKNIFYEDFKAFSGMRVALVKNNYHNQAFETYCKQRNITYTSVYVEDPSDLEKTLNDGRADAFAAGSLITSHDTKVVAKFSIEPFYFGVAKGHQQVTDGLNRAMQAIQIENGQFGNELYQKYFKTASISQTARTREEHEYVQQHPVLRVAFNSQLPPLEYYDDKTKKYKGINVNVLKLIAQKSGLVFTPLPFDASVTSLAAFEQGQADLVGAFPGIDNMTRPDASQTQPFLHIPIVVAAKRNMPPREFTLAVHRNSPALAHVRKKYGENTLRYYSSREACFDAVLSNTTSALLVNSYEFNEALRMEEKYKDLRVMEVLEEAFPMRFAVAPHTDQRLISIINKSISRISGEELTTQIMAHHGERAQPISVKMILENYAYPLLGIAFLVVMLFIGLVVYHNRKEQKILRHLAYEDELTGLGNWEKLRLAQRHTEPYGATSIDQAHSHFVYSKIEEDDAKGMLACGKKGRIGLRKKGVKSKHLKRLALVMVDINNFKLVNEYYGYATGNTALRDFGQLLQQRLKSGELAVRMSADLFGLLMYCYDWADLKVRLKHVAGAVAAAEKLQFSGINLTLAFGVAFLEDKSIDISVIRDRADIARKKHKTPDHHSYGLYDKMTHKLLTEEKELGEEVRNAFAQRSFTVYLQPKYGLKENRFISAEALVRWEHPERGLISPETFITILEKNGYIKQLDMYVLDEVCHTLRQWQDQHFPLLPIAVNISKLHVLYENFVPEVRAIVEKYKISPRYVELELTESAFLNNAPQLLKVMRALSEIGFTLTIDDFGTGFSSLNMLREIPVDVLKLDRAFFDFSTCNERGKMIISHVIKMAKALHMHVVSEGIETLEQVDFLRNTDCDMIQGYFFAHPMTIPAFTTLLYGTLQDKEKEKEEDKEEDKEEE